MFAAVSIAAVVDNPESGRPLGVEVVLLRRLSVDDRLSVADAVASYDGGKADGNGPAAVVDGTGTGFFVADEEDEE